MGVLKPCYPKSMLVEGENVPHFKEMSNGKMKTPTGPSDVFQILQELQSEQQADNWSESPVQSISFRTTTPFISASELMMTATSTQGNISSMTTQAFPVKSTAWSGPPAPGGHVHKPPTHSLKPGDSVTLSKSRHH